MNDRELLRGYVRDGLEECFHELVRQKFELVYAAALRQVRGDHHRAKDVAQTVFIALARQSASLVRHPSLTGWLYTTTRNAACAAMRADLRRERREAAAYSMNANDHSGPAETETSWTQIRKVLDEAMHNLGNSDREILLLRFFEDQSLGAVGQRTGLSEDAVRKRIARALERLQRSLSRCGVDSTAAALAAGLAQGATVAAPPGFAIAASGAAIAALGSGGLAGGGIGLLLMSKTTFAIGLGVLILGSVAAYRYEAIGFRAEDSARAADQQRQIATLQREIGELRSLTKAAEPPAERSKPAGEDAAMMRLAALSQAISEGGMSAQVSWEKSTLDETLLAIGGILELTPAQMTALRDSAEKARAEIEANALRAATVTRSATSVYLVTRDLPENHLAYDRMLHEFVQILGPARYDFYERLGARHSVEAILRRSGLGADSASFYFRDATQAYGVGLEGKRGNQSGYPPGRLRGWPAVQANPNPLMLGGFGTQTREEAKAMLGYLGALIPDDI